jgi:hypothetical protein
VLVVRFRIREAQGVFQLNEEGMHDACFYI